MGSVRGPGAIESAGIGPYWKCLMKRMGLGPSGRILGLSILGFSEGELVFRFSIFLRGHEDWIESNIPIRIPTGPLWGPMGPISDFSDFWPLGPPRNFLESFRGAALRAGCAYRTK